METKVIIMQDLKEGMHVKSVKTGEVFEVTDITDKVTIYSPVSSFKVLSESTLKRWYRLIIEDREAQEEVVQEPKVAVQVEEAQKYAQHDMVPPVQPAIQPRNTVKHAPNQQQEDPVLVELRQKLIAYMLTECANCEAKDTNSYTALKVGKYNFAEVYKGKRRFNIRLLSDALSCDQLKNCLVAPKSYGWTLDATFTILQESDYVVALELLKASYSYRYKNPPKRGFTKK